MRPVGVDLEILLRTQNAFSKKHVVVKYKGVIEQTIFALAATFVTLVTQDKHRVLLAWHVAKFTPNVQSARVKLTILCNVTFVLTAMALTLSQRNALNVLAMTLNNVHLPKMVMMLLKLIFYAHKVTF